MKIGIHNHQGKADALYYATQRAGIENDPDSPDVILIDFDNKPWYRSIIDKHPKAKLVLYTHGLGSLVCWDGIFQSDPRTICYLAQSEWEKKSLEKIGYPHPIEVIGWHFCEILPFFEKKEPESILFAPIHPLGDGYIRDTFKTANLRAFFACRNTGLPLTVRTIGVPPESGIPDIDGVDYKYGHPINWDSVEMIDQFDLIMGFSTFAHLAVARGKPTVMFGRDIHPSDSNGVGRVYAETFKSYEQLYEYPYWLNGDELPEIIDDPKEWRDYHIGQPFDEDKFIKILNDLS